MLSELLIGAGSTIITPPLGCQMAGFDARQGVATKVHDDLHARTLLLDDGATKIALISVEVIGFNGSFADEVRAQVEQRTGTPARNVILAATHTHCGPVTFNHFFNQGQPLDQTYMRQLFAGILESVDKALASMRKGRIRSGLICADGIAVNRRTADGKPVDSYAGVLMAEELDGKPIAMSVSFSCHPTTLGPNTLEITADFPYYAIKRLHEALGQQVEVLFFNGAEGNVSIGHKSDLSAVGVIAPFRTFEKAEELGLRLANATLAGLAGLTPQVGCLAAERHTVSLPLKSFRPVPEMRSRRIQALEQIRDLEAKEPGTTALLRAKQQGLFARMEEYYAVLREQTSGPEPKVLTAELVGMRIGETALLSFPGEFFVEISLEIRKRSPFPVTIFAGLANDYIGYVPTADADASSGYEVVASRVIPEAAGLLADAGVNLLNDLCAQGHAAPATSGRA